MLSLVEPESKFYILKFSIRSHNQKTARFSLACLAVSQFLLGG